MLAIVRRITFALLVISFPVCASESPPPPADTAILAPVVVSGEQPGPGLWKVTRDGHVLWILGTTRPLPKKMSWLARDVETVIAESAEVILPPHVDMRVKGGMIGGLLLMPSLLGARNNPDDKRLADVLPPDLYARWSALKQKYLARDGAVEKRRPVFAAFELFEAAIDQSGLSFKDIVEPVVRRAAKRGKVTVTEPLIELKIDKARAALKEFAKTSLDDTDCLRKTVERLEGNLDVLQQRANAWAVGDIEALAGLTYVDQYKACQDALLRSAVAEERGMDELPGRVRKAWLDAVDQALSQHATSFAAIGIITLTEAGGYLDGLRALGAEIEPPP